MRRGGRPGAPRALAVPTGPLGSAGPPQTAETIFSCILERLTENWLRMSTCIDGVVLLLVKNNRLRNNTQRGKSTTTYQDTHTTY